jgi:hypothetical protein
MRATLLLFAAGLLLVCMAGGAIAHSTKGLVKAQLKKDTLAVNDVAFFVESYVMRELYDDKNSRFVVKDFVAVKQEGNKALIDFVVYDKKENRSFPEKMNIEQAADKVWSYRPKNGGEPIVMSTYVAKGSQAGGGSNREALMGGLALVAVVLGGLMVRKKISSGQLVKAA